MNYKLLFCFLLIFSFQLIFQQIATSQANQQFRITDVSYYPKTPKVFEDINVTVEVENSFDQGENLRVTILVLKDGIVGSSSDSNFFLDGNKRKTILFSHGTEDIGEHQMIIKLYKKSGNTELDSKIVNFTSTSDVGPFDISVNSLSDNVEPGVKIPLLLKTINKGQQGTDIDIKMTVSCSKQPNIETEFVFYLEGNHEDQRVVTVPTCEKESGLHSAFAEMRFYNKTLLSSLTQFYLSQNPLKILIDTYKIVTVTHGQQKSFDVNVMNPNNVSLDNLKLVIADIPSSWYEVKPSVIKQLNQNETAIFVVDLNVPTSATSETYPLTVYATSLQVLSKVPLELELNKVSQVQQTNGLNYLWIIILVTGAGVAGVLYFARRKFRGMVVRRSRVSF